MAGQLPASRKVNQGPIGGSIAIILIWAISYAGISVTDEVAVALTTVIIWLTGWLVREESPQS